VRARPGGNTAQAAYKPHVDRDGIDIRLLLAASQRDYSHVRVFQPSLRVAVLPADVFRRARGRDELDRLQPVSVRLAQRQFPERVSHPAAVLVYGFRRRRRRRRKATDN